MNRNICLFVMCLAFFACTSSKGVYVRVKNESNHDVSNVSILWEDKKDELYIEHIRSGETTKYYPVEVAYRYGRIEMTIDGERALLQPEDYVGEEPLDPGRYSYILSIDPNAADIYSRITIKCVKDAR